MARSKVRVPALSLALGLAVGVTACDITGGGDPLGDEQQFATELSVMELQNSLQQEAARVEITLYREGIVIRELEIKSREALSTKERVEGRVKAIERTDAGVFLVLNIEDLKVGIGNETRFTARSADEALDFETLLARITGALADGKRPAVAALRPPPTQPQGPDDERFFATDLRLLGEGEGRIIEMNVDADNLIREENPPPDAWAALLARRFEIRIREGITHLERERPQLEKEHFEGVVESVNLDRNTFQIHEGPAVRIIPGETEIRYEDGDQHRLGSLEEVDRAIKAGMKVYTAGVGVVEGVEPLRLIAIAVVWEVAPPPMEDFESLIREIDLTDSILVLNEGVLVKVTAETHIRTEADHEQLLGSLEEVAAALREGRDVVAAGIGVVIGNEPLVIEAVKIVFVVRPPPLEEFRGEVELVDLTEKIVTLTDGTVVWVKDDTDIWFGENDAHQLGSLEAVAAALEAGRTVIAAGVGEVVAEEPLTICAKKIMFIVQPPDHVAFQGVVASVHAGEGVFTLQNGTTVQVTDETVIWFQADDANSLRSLAAVAEMLEEGHTVVAAGVGELQPVATGNAQMLVAIKVAFLVAPPGLEHFEGTITEVNVDARSFILDNGIEVRIVEGTMVVHEHADASLESFEAVAEVVRSGGRVKAAGLGLVETSDPPVLIAISVVFRV